MVTYLFSGYQETIEAKMVKYKNTKLWGTPLLAFMKANGPRSYLSIEFPLTSFQSHYKSLDEIRSMKG